MKKRLILVMVLWLTHSLVAQDVEVRFHERILNSVVQVLAPVSGSGDFDSPLGKQHYSWTLKNPRLVVHPDGLGFLADTSVTIGGFPYETTAKGRAVVTVIDAPTKVNIKVAQASFGLELNVFGNKIHITDIDISSVVNQAVNIEVPTFSQRVQIPGQGSRAAKTIQLEAGTPNISFSPPFLVVGAPLILR